VKKERMRMPVVSQYMRSSLPRTRSMVFGLLFVLVLLFPMTPANCEDVQGRVACWKLDEGTGENTVDSAEDHDGNLMNGPQWVIERSGSALSFDGENDYVLMPFSEDFDFDNRDFSLVVLVKTEDVYSQTQDTRILNYGGSTFNQYMLLCQNDGRVCFYIDAGGGPANVYTNKAVDDGKWHLIVAVRDNTENCLRIYLDGEIQNTAIGGAGNLRNKENSRRFAIGRRQKGGIGQTHSYFEGVMDEIAVYNRTLSDPEAHTLYLTFYPLPGPYSPGSWPTTIHAIPVAQVRPGPLRQTGQSRSRGNGEPRTSLTKIAKTGKFSRP